MGQGLRLTVNCLPNSVQLKTDIDGSELPQYRLGEKMLGDSEYLLMSDVNPNSFDARYFGLIVSLQIQHVVEPVFTWGY